jgi:multiple sugar transport system substrate-binding protein
MSGEFDKRVKRRDILKAGAVLGLGIPGIGAFLAACSNAASTAAPTAAASAAASAGASGAPSSAASAAASAAAAVPTVTVNLYDTMPQATQQEWLNTWYPQFQKLYPTVTIKETNGGIENPQSVRQLVAANTDASPDMAWMESGEMGAYSGADLLADVDTWLNGKPDVKADIYPSLLTLCTYNGKVQTLPWMTNNCAMLINTDAFAAAGVAIPDQDPQKTWTWEDFEAACQAITAKGDMKGYLMNATQNGWDAWLFHAWLGTAGGTFMSEAGDPLFNSQQGVDAMTFLQGLVKKGYTSPLDKGWELTLWFNKKAAITTNGPWNLPDLVKFTDFKYTVVPFPRHTQPATNIGGDNLFVFKHGADKEAGCFAYADYMLSKDFQVAFNIESGNLPVTKSATADPAYQAQLQKFPFLLGWVNSVPYGVARSSLPQATDAQAAFGKSAWDPIILQGGDIKQSLDAAAAAVTALKP